MGTDAGLYCSILNLFSDKTDPSKSLWQTTKLHSPFMVRMKISLKTTRQNNCVNFKQETKIKEYHKGHLPV